MIAVKVKTVTGETRSVEVGKEWSGAQLREAVCGKLGVSADSVQLIARGRVLSDSDECMDAVREGGASVHVVPRARSGFDLAGGRRMGHPTHLPGMSLEKPDDVAKFLETMAEMGDVGDAQVVLKVEGRDGAMVESKVGLKELVDALTHASKNRIGPFGDNGTQQQTTSATPNDSSANTNTNVTSMAGPAVDPNSPEEVHRRAFQEIYDKGRELYEERERKNAETIRISSKLQEIKDKRAARAAKKWKREQRRRGQLSTEGSSMPKAPLASSPPLFAGLRKGFLL